MTTSKQTLFTTAFLIFTISSFSFAQNAKPPKVKFGDVSKEDLFMKSYSKDTSAHAVVLYHTSNVSYSAIDRGNKVEISINNIIHCRIKIFNKSALNLADIIVPYSKNERFNSFKAITYNLDNGEIIKDKLEKENVFDENYTDGLRVKKFTLPNVKEGSIIEYIYNINSPYFTSIDTWEFQREIPVAWSEVKVKIPDFLIFKKHTSGLLPFDLIENSTDNMPPGLEHFGTVANTYHYAIKDAPALKSEPYISTPKNYLSLIGFELTGTEVKGQFTTEFSGGWRKIAKTLMESEDFGMQIKYTELIRESINEISSKIDVNDTLKTLQVVNNYVKGKIKWNNKSGFITTLPLKKVLEKGEGNPADINFFVLNILQGLGYEANPVILSTRSNGWLIEYLPNLKKLNYMVVGVKLKNGTTTFIDATEKYLPAGLLPERCLNGVGVMFFKKSENYEIVELLTKEKENSFTKLNMKINEEGEITGEYTRSGGGLFAADFKEIVMKDGQNKYIEDYKKSHPTWEIQKMDLANFEDLDKLPEMKCNFKVTDIAQSVNDKIYFKPMMEFGESENPFKQEKRQFMVDLAKPFEKTHIIVYELPKGYIVEESPKNTSVSMPEGAAKFTFSSQISGDKITITSRLLVKTPYFTVESYPILKEFYNQVIAKHAEQIVLKKGN
jgi:hypothetical protein